MLRHASALVLGAVVAAVVVACTSTAEPNRPASAPSDTSATTSDPAPRASAVTIDACRSLATNESLAEFWRKIANGEQVIGADATLAGTAVTDLGQWVNSPELDVTVKGAMASAVLLMAAMNQDRLNGVPFDVERFRSIVTPVVTACQDAGVDMAVTTN